MGPSSNPKFPMAEVGKALELTATRQCGKVLIYP